MSAPKAHEFTRREVAYALKGKRLLHVAKGYRLTAEERRDGVWPVDDHSPSELEFCFAGLNAELIGSRKAA